MGIPQVAPAHYVDVLELHDENDEAGKRRRVFA